MLSSLFEMYSAQTLYHSKVTAIIAYKLAKYMKIKNVRCKKIYVAGLAHDLGKVCIPLKILEKPDKLTDTEYNRMKKHVEYTKEILTFKMDYDIIEIAYRHHEKMDGTGYPNKIKGQNLTIDQQILQVADVISALIAKRSYKEAWSIEKTISILEDSATNNKLSLPVIECFKKNQVKILKASTILMNQADKIYAKLNKERDELKCEKDS
jgi:putative nucleotidyltransferase with HDIG domain